MDRQFIIIVCVGLYMAACIGVGLWAMRRTKNAGDFFMAGRHLGAFVTAMAIFSSTLSGFGFVGGPGLVYRMGMSSVWMVVCVTMGYALSFFLLAKRLRLFAEVLQPISLPDVVATRYQSQTTRLLISLAILCGVMGYLAAQIKAMATVLQQILQKSQGTDISLEMCVAVSCAVLVFYCVTGGIIASVYTDLFQGVIMIFAAILVFITAATAVQGGFTGMSQTIMQDDPEAMGPWGTLGMMGCLSWYFLFVLGGSGQPHIITKMMMNRRVQDAKLILPISLAGYCLSALLWISIGLAMRALVLQGLHPELESADAAAPQFLQTYAHPILAGVVFAGLFAAIMSTADGFLNVGAAAIVHDIPQAIRGRSLVRELLWARIGTIVLAIGASLFAIYSPFGLVALLGKYGWGIFASAVVPVVAIGFNWKRATATAANVSIIASLAINFAILGLGKFDFVLPFGIDGSALALLVSLTLFFSVSLLTKPRKMDPVVEAVMDI
ncbi:MAG: sodium/proline symporter [Pirellulaceae bacterium]|nr:sodium/proline symporter [Planctomycetaceae bacterium]